MSWQGGGHQFGDRVDTGDMEIYPRGFNKSNAAFAKGNVLFADPATGNLRLATTGDRGPFYVAYNASLGSDPKQHCWYKNDTWLVLEPVGNIKVGALVIPNAGKISDIGSNITTGVLGIYIGLADEDANLNSNNIINQNAAIGDKAVVRLYNVVRLPIA
jgi:hypothetical protein